MMALKRSRKRAAGGGRTSALCAGGVSTAKGSEPGDHGFPSCRGSESRKYMHFRRDESDRKWWGGILLGWSQQIAFDKQRHVYISAHGRRAAETKGMAFSLNIFISLWILFKRHRMGVVNANTQMRESAFAVPSSLMRTVGRRSHPVNGK